MPPSPPAPALSCFSTSPPGAAPLAASRGARLAARALDHRAMGVGGLRQAGQAIGGCLHPSVARKPGGTLEAPRTVDPRELRGTTDQARARGLRACVVLMQCGCALPDANTQVGTACDGKAGRRRSEICARFPRRQSPSVQHGAGQKVHHRSDYVSEAARMRVRVLGSADAIAWRIFTNVQQR
jgi:hypothetical protein